MAVLTGVQTYTGDKRFIDDVILDGSTGGGVIRGDYPASSSTMSDSRVTGDTNTRYSVDADGRAVWGPGNAPADTTLYRDSAGVLRTDGALHVDGNAELGNAITDLIGLYGATAVAQAAAIAAPSAPGALYSQAEAQSAVDAINFIRTALGAALGGVGVTA